LELNYLQKSGAKIGEDGREAMGGVLEIRALFPGGGVRIDLLNKLSA
jgi:hypothetical protein